MTLIPLSLGMVRSIQTLTCFRSAFLPPPFFLRFILHYQDTVQETQDTFLEIMSSKRRARLKENLPLSLCMQ